MKSIVVVGTEHVSFSAIWTARHAGLKVHMMLDEAPRIGSFRPAAWLAKAMGIDIRVRTRITAIKGQDNRVSGVVIDGPRGTETIACDGVVFTAKWIPEVAALTPGPVKIDSRTGAIVVRDAGMTSLEGVFAAGNVLHPVKASGSCAIQGRRVGAAVAAQLECSTALLTRPA